MSRDLFIMSDASFKSRFRDNVCSSQTDCRSGFEMEQGFQMYSDCREYPKSALKNRVGQCERKGTAGDERTRRRKGEDCETIGYY
jgi:hypothetical protein